MTDYSQDAEFQEWAERVRAHVLPQLKESSLTLQLVPEDVDIKFAVELGMSIMLDKPIIAVVRPGMKVPERLIRVADRIVEMGDMDDPKQRERTQKAIEQAMKEIPE